MKKIKHIALLALVLGVFGLTPPKSQALPPATCTARVWVKDYFVGAGWSIAVPAQFVRLYNASGQYVRTLTSAECANGFDVENGGSVKIGATPYWTNAGCGNNIWAITGIAVCNNRVPPKCSGPSSPMGWWACGATVMTFVYTWDCAPEYPVAHIDQPD